MNRLVVEPVSRHGPYLDRLAADRIAAYAAATGDDTRGVLTGRAVPPVFPVILAFAAQQAANADLPAAAWEAASGGVHGEHDILLHRPLEVDEPLQTWSKLSAIRTVPAGAQVVLHVEQFGADGRLAVEHWWTTILLGLRTLADTGSPPGDHRFPESARTDPIGSATYRVHAQTARRYAEVSGDWSAHHFDIAAARASGFDFLFTHGLCTMAICAHRVLSLVGVDDPGRVSRAAVRFSSPTPLGADLVVHAYRITGRSVAFEATSDGVTTVRHGRMEFRP
ncbi:MAG TPA: MaoC/PaaZ C-terminal domain-containing protein [Mycobacterium sp.]|nr:MaoC/PaaZ C-terminal domain-containing protein [Mycobacterium sp.]